MILEMSKFGLKLCWSVQSVLFSLVWCCFPNSKGTELFWVTLILIYCTVVGTRLGEGKRLRSFRTQETAFTFLF